MKVATKTMYATMPPWKLFFVVSLPGMISMFTMSIYSIIEGVFIGHKLGEAAFAAVNVALPIVMINNSLADMVGVGSSVPISIALGRKDDEAANNIFSCAVIIILLMALIMGIVMLFAAEPLARFMGAGEDIVYTAVKYIRTFALCSPLITIFFAMDNYLRISGFIKTSMFINIFSNFATIGFLVLFLFVLEMDVAGSALASCISLCLCSLMAMVPFVRGRALLKFIRPRFSIAMIKKIVSCGAPTFLNNMAGRVTSILMNMSLAALGRAALGEGGGTTAIAAYAVLMYASEICQPLLYGMSDSLAPALGFNWGAEDYGRVRKLAMCNFTGAGIVGAAASAVMFLFADQLTALFVSEQSANLTALAAHALRLFSCTYLVRWFTIAAQSLLSAIEQPVHATIMSVCVALVFPVAMLGALRWMGLDGIWLNMLGTSVLSLILGIVLIRNVWKGISGPGRISAN